MFHVLEISFGHIADVSATIANPSFNIQATHIKTVIILTTLYMPIKPHNFL